MPDESGPRGIRFFLRGLSFLAAIAFLGACQPEVPGDGETGRGDQGGSDSPIPGGDPWARGDVVAPDNGFPGMNSSSRVQVTLADTPDELVPGESHQLKIRLEMEPNWHVMANPVSMEFLIPTEIRIPDTPAATIVAIDYPDGETFRVEVLDESVKVYKDSVEIPVTLRVSDAAVPGRHRMTGTVRVQACDDAVCLAPSNVPVEFAFTVNEG